MTRGQKSDDLLRRRVIDCAIDHRVHTPSIPSCVRSPLRRMVPRSRHGRSESLLRESVKPACASHAGDDTARSRAASRRGPGRTVPPALAPARQPPPEMWVNPLRPGRYERRVRKRRPPEYALMTKPGKSLRKALRRNDDPA